MAMVNVNVTVYGRKPYIQHNARLANPLDPYTRQLKQMTSKRNKTDEEIEAIAHIESRAGLYETAENTVGMPTSALFRAILDAAAQDKLKTTMKKAFSMVDDVVEPILIDGKEIACDDFLSSPDSLFYRSVKVGQQRVMRARPVVNPDWQATHRFSLNTKILDIDRLEPILVRAGLEFGVGDWRPIYGTFDVRMEVAE